MKPSATETASAISLDPVLYLDDIWLVVLGETVVSGGVGGTGLGVDGTVEFTLGCGVLTGGVDAGPVGRSPSGQLIQREVSVSSGFPAEEKHFATRRTKTSVLHFVFGKNFATSRDSQISPNQRNFEEKIQKIRLNLKSGYYIHFAKVKVSLGN
jgi:hypothetical protein